MDQARKLPELLLPAGSFDSGLAAFEGGADAVYLGFPSFSARAQARNLGPEEYRRLLAHARGLGRKVYVALNTLVFDDELQAVAELASFLAHFRPDAVIVQDWGIVRLLRHAYPGLSIHASTQMAIQTAEAAALAGTQGISRIVLPRETGLAGIRDFIARTPGMEFEVFIHGALCYSYSGLCHASGVLLGRSGNRGQCAQICRSWFERSDMDERGGQPGYWFSCRDLDLSGSIGELVRAGVSSLKVEGRMKSPEYCHAVARMYRTALDSTPDAPGKMSPAAPAVQAGGVNNFPTAHEVAKSEARLAFSRAPTEGYLGFHAGVDLIDAAYPGHRGLPVGTVMASRPVSRPGLAGFELEIALSGILGLRDGLMFFPRPSPAEPEKFGVHQMRDAQTGRPLAKALPGDRVIILAPAAAAPGTEISRISARYLDRKEHAPEEFPPALMAIGMRISVRDGLFRADLRIPACTGLPGQELCSTVVSDEILPFERASSPQGFARALSVFAQSGAKEFRLLPDLDTDPATGPGLPPQGIPVADLFLPPSRLKAVKKALYEDCSRIVESMRKRHALESVASAVGAEFASEADFARALAAASATGFAASGMEPPPRSNLVFPYDRLPQGMPYATPRVLESRIPLPEYSGFLWLPLAPLVRDFAAYAELVTSRIEAESASGKRVMLGLSAFHHIPFALDLARSIARAVPEPGRPGFFADTTLNLANAASVLAVREMLGPLAFAYPPAELSRDYTPPLFHSMGCLLRHSRNGGRCPENCSREWLADYSGRSGRFRAIVEDCVTMVFLLR